MLDFRDAYPDRYGEVERIWSLVYRRGGPLTLDPGDNVEGRNFLADLDGTPVAAFEVEPLLLTRGDGRIPTGGVAAVAVLPEHRHQGVGRAMMRWSLDLMRDQGLAIAALYAFRTGYYRRFGYEVAGRRWQITCPQHRLPRLEPRLPVRRVMPEDVLDLRPAYEAFARKLSGCNIRTDAAWRNRMGENAPTIYTVGDPIEAYAWTSWEGSFWEELKVGEFCWATPEGHRSMLAVLTGMAINRSSLTWHEPTGSPFLAQWNDQGVVTSLERSAMFRVLDVPRAFAGVPASTEGEFTVEVRDDVLPEVAGVWRVRFGPSGVHAERAQDAGLAMDVRQLAQAILGEPSLAELLDQGLVHVHRSADADAALRLLTPRPTCLYDFF